MKRISVRIISFAAAVMSISCLISSCSDSTEDKSAESSSNTWNVEIDEQYDSEIKLNTDYSQVASDNGLGLYVNGKAEVMVKNMSTGDEWYSNPPEWETDTVAGGTNMDVLGSQVLLDYVRQKDGIDVSLNSYKDSISHSRYYFYKIDDGIGVKYILGDPIEVYLTPEIISVERFEYFLSRLDEEDQSTLTYNYRLISLNNITDEASKEVLLEKYPIIKKRDVYVLGGNSIGQAKIGALLKKKIDAAFRAAGYTEKDLEQDNKENGVEYEEQIDYSVTLSVEYKLIDGSLQVSVPNKSISYDTTVMSVSNISVLPMFGACSNKEDGAIFVPDGCGSLIYFNNGKINVPSYSRNLYEADSVVESDTYSVNETLLNMQIGRAHV